MKLLKVVVVVLMCGGLGLLAYADGPKPSTPASPSKSARGALFVDVPADHYAASDLKFLVERGIITGLPNGEFQGTKALSRYDAAVLIARAVRYLQNDPGKIQPQDLKILQDLIFKVSERVQGMERLESDVKALKDRPVNDPQSTAKIAELTQKLSQSESQIVQLQNQVQALRQELQQAKASATIAAASAEEIEQLRQRANTSIWVAAFAALAGVIAVIWAIAT
ncbi:MAG: S-layer homology domain-containing protein [Candidatus Bipolaricaulota bacterium]|nr:S-layer homology domain-containing protein [Candidatus Bipolaricaulota bacterium]MCS7273931.1 S-layer homology domain-containing protein [Candidatus Bipolaricaulota bacterium]MDW8111075.1 S-layer homology domain-containing protein [Candidatus Bipolaricaulota bacterium]MDW8329890.1 S-layer homology domain-containing protein [Candidatus Bipolaricaulota bacterium]